MGQGSRKAGGLFYAGRLSIGEYDLLDSKPASSLNLLLTILLILGGLMLQPPASVQAASAKEPPGPNRIAAITMNYTAYTWWMASWSRNQVVCSIVIDHDGEPTPGEVYTNCDPAIYNTWKNQKLCAGTGIPHSKCEGFYIYLVKTEHLQKKVPVNLSPPTVWLSLEGCKSVSSSKSGTNLCEIVPQLVLRGEEPLPNEHILRVEGVMDGQSFACGPVCKLQLAATVDKSVDIRFWAWSSYGDSSEPFSAQVQVRAAEAGDPNRNSWYVDVLSSQWLGAYPATCANTWRAFPPIGSAPDWLSTPQNPADLISDIPYNYLSASLISHHVVDAIGCPNGGRSPAGMINQCGLEAARPTVEAWQNQFDALILNTAHNTGVPARLLKNLFGRESQFWPGDYRASNDAGLGQLTENGADTTLFWNPSFYNQYCPLVLSSQLCGKGYAHLEEGSRELLRQSLVRSVNGACSNCPLGIDLSQASFSVDVFANTLLAECEQTAQVILNNVPSSSTQSAGDFASYEDLWKFTLVNYNAGAGCLGLSVNGTWSVEHKLTWDAMASHFTEVCAPAQKYVDDISK